MKICSKWAIMPALGLFAIACVDEPQETDFVEPERSLVETAPQETPQAHQQALGMGVVTNGNFASGDYTGWTLFQSSPGESAGTWGVASDGQEIAQLESVFDHLHQQSFTQYSPGLPRVYNAVAGQYVGLHLQNGPSFHRMYQDVDVPNCAPRLYWHLQYQNHNSWFDVTQQYVSVNIRDVATDAILATLYKTEAGDPLEIPMTGFDESLQAWAGQQVRLDFEFSVHFYYLDVAFDAIDIGCDGPFALVNPDALDFGEQRVGTSSNAETVTLENSGAEPLEVNAIDVSGPFTVSGLSVGDTLAVGDSMTFEVVFAPTEAGPVTGVISIESNAENAPTAISLEGTGIESLAAADASSLNYGEVRLGETSTQSVTLENTGSASLNIESVTIAAPYALSGLAAGDSVAPGASVTFDVVFSPTSAGLASQDLVLVSDAANSPTTISLAGTGVESVAVADASSLNYGEVRVGETSTQSVTLENTGSASLNIESVTIAAPYALSGLAAGDVIAPGASVAFDVVFSPTSTGPAPQDLVIVSDAANSPTTIALAGTGVESEAVADASSLNYGDVRVGSSSAQSVTLENTGSASLNIESVTIAAPYALSGLAAGDSVAPGASVAFDVVFSPTSTGPAPQDLVIVSDAANSPTTISLDGTGVESVAILAQSAIDFGDVRVGTTSETEYVALTNTGTAPLNISAADVSGPFSLEGLEVGDSIAPGDSVTLEVTFHPAEPGEIVGSVLIESDAANGTQTIALDGVGIAPGLDTQSIVDFGVVAVGEEVQQTLSLTNSGDDDLLVEALTIAGANEEDFTLVNPPQLPLTIAPGQSESLVIEHNATARGARQATLQILSDAWQAETVVVELQSQAEGPAIDVDATALYLGASNVGVRSAEGTLLVSNDGERDLTLTAVSITGGQASEFRLETVLPLVVEPGESISLAFTFEPGAVGPRAATAWISHDDLTVAAVEVELSGLGTSPMIAVSPSTLYFGDVRVGTVEGPVEVEVENTGTGPLTLAEITLSSPFTIDALSLPLVLEPGEQETISVYFAPTAIGAASVTMQMESDDLDTPTVEVDLSGQGVAPGMALSEDSIDFGAHQVGRRSAVRTLDILNNGTDVLTIEDLVIEGSGAERFQILNLPEFPHSLEIEEALTVELVFEPQSVSTYQAQLQIDSDHLESPRTTVNLSGVGLSQAISATPLELDFGAHRAPVTTATPRVVSVTNHSDDVLAIESVALRGDSAADFELLSAAPAQIGAGESVELEVNFVAEFSAQSQARLVIEPAHEAVPAVEIQLTGRAFGGAFTAEPSSHDFGEVYLGESSDALEVTLTSVVGHEVEIDRIVSDHDDFEIFFEGPFVVEGGEEISFTVVFAPGDLGERTGRIEVYLVDSDDPEMAVNVSGVGVEDGLDGNLTGGGCGCATTDGAGATWPALLVVLLLLARGRGLRRELRLG